MTTLRTRLEAAAVVLTEPEWIDLWLPFILVYGTMLRVNYDQTAGLGGAFARWGLSLMLAVYGATLAMSVLVLGTRAGRALLRRRVAT